MGGENLASTAERLEGFGRRLGVPLTATAEDSLEEAAGVTLRLRAALAAKFAALVRLSPDIGRAAPQYLNVRQKVTPDGADVDLNATDDVMTPLGEEGFWVRHFIDHTADGWVVGSTQAGGWSTGKRSGHSARVPRASPTRNAEP